MNARTKRAKKAFEEIAVVALANAEGVDCEFSDFVEGLEDIVATLRDRLDMAKDEQREKERDGE